MSDPTQAPQGAIPEGWQLVPVEPTEAQWGGLARDILSWLYSHAAPHYGSKLHAFLCNLGRDIPDWLAKVIPDVDHTPAKGDVAFAIYQAFLASAPAAPPEQPAPLVGEWLMIAPDGKRFEEKTPLKCAVAANRYRLELDPEAARAAAENIKRAIDEGLADNAAENQRLLEQHGTLDCPACGGSGHIGDVAADRLAARSTEAQAPAVPAWQPIETAPKSGLIDVLVDEGRRYIDCYWDAICGEYRCIDSSGTLIRLGNAKFWMPPPAAPTLPAAQEPQP